MAVIGNIEVKFTPRAGGQKIDQQAINRVVNGPGVRRDLRRRANNVADYQRSAVGVMSGRLLGTIRVEEGKFRTGASAVVTVGRSGSTPHLRWHMYGTGPHEILPRRAKMLSWVGEGGRVFRRRVYHPGNPPNTFVEDSTRFWAP